MQRWIVIGVVAMILAMGGAVAGYRVIKQNRPSPIWVPMPVNPELPGDKRDEIRKELKGKLKERGLLGNVVKDLGLAKAWGLASDEAAIDELSRRVFVDSGETITPTGPVPTFNIGVTGKVKEKGLSEKIAMRLMDDVWKILGIDPPPRGD